MDVVLQQATPAVDPARFRQVLGCFPTGVAVITTVGPDRQPAGLTCNSFSSVSLEPPLVLFSLRKASRLLDTFTAARGFVINILSEQQDVLSARFASSKITDKFDGIGWREGHLGMPVIDACLASLACAVVDCHDAGDHVIFIGEVKHIDAGTPQPALVFYKGGYRVLADSLRSAVLQRKLSDESVDEAYRALYGTLLRLACERADDREIDAVQAAVEAIEAQTPDAPLTERIASADGFLSSIAAAGHNEVLTRMADTLSHVMRERMTHVLPVRPRPDLFPLRRAVLEHLRQRAPDHAAAALDELIARRRSTETSKAPDQHAD